MAANQHAETLTPPSSRQPTCVLAQSDEPASRSSIRWPARNPSAAWTLDTGHHPALYPMWRPVPEQLQPYVPTPNPHKQKVCTSCPATVKPSREGCRWPSNPSVKTSTPPHQISWTSKSDSQRRKSKPTTASAIEGQADLSAQPDRTLDIQQCSPSRLFSRSPRAGVESLRTLSLSIQDGEETT